MHHLLYHANCADGFAAVTLARAALLQRGIALADIHTQAVNYGWPQQLPGGLTSGDTITYLDYTPPQEVIDCVVSLKTVPLTLIDHHSTAAPRHNQEPGTQNQEPLGFTSVFDLTHSGAALTWLHFFPGQPLPRAVELIEWRDLGHAFHPENAGTETTTAALNLHACLFRARAREFNGWELALFAPAESLAVYELAIGARLREGDRLLIQSAAQTPHWLDFSQSPRLPASLSGPSLSRIPAVNGLGAELISDACNALLAAHPAAPFTASWYVDPKTGSLTYSLRSRPANHPGHVNVAQIAAALAPGGGGHPCAAGFSTTHPILFSAAPHP